LYFIQPRIISIFTDLRQPTQQQQTWKHNNTTSITASPPPRLRWRRRPYRKTETTAVTRGRKEEQTLILERESLRHMSASDYTVKLVKLVKYGQLVKLRSIL